MDNIKDQNMLKDPKIKTVSFTQYSVVACLFAVHLTLFSVVCFKIRVRSVGARILEQKGLEKLRKKWGSVFETLSRHLPGGTTENNEKVAVEIPTGRTLR